jgi:entericidin B
MENIMRRALLLIGLATLTLAATACNTVRGVGQDIESVADKVDRET